MHLQQGTPYSDVDDLVFRLAPTPSPPSAMPSESPTHIAPSQSPSSLAPTTAPTIPANPTSSPVASNFRFVCAANPNDARAQCLDNPLCATGADCEDGFDCIPIHCTECPDITCIGSPTVSPTKQTNPPSVETNFPTAMPSYSINDDGLINSSQACYNSWAFFVGAMLFVIDVLLVL